MASPFPPLPPDLSTLLPAARPGSRRDVSLYCPGLVFDPLAAAKIEGKCWLWGSPEAAFSVGFKIHTPPCSPPPSHLTYPYWMYHFETGLSPTHPPGPNLLPSSRKTNASAFLCKAVMPWFFSHRQHHPHLPNTHSVSPRLAEAMFHLRSVTSPGTALFAALSGQRLPLLQGLT